MPFASFNPTNPMSDPVNFHKKILRIGDFESAILIFFPSSLIKLVTNYVLGWMGLNFYDYDGLQPKTISPKKV